MTYKYITLIDSLGLSARSYYCMTRAFERTSEIFTAGERRAAEALRNVSNYEDIADVVREFPIRNLGKKSIQEIIDKCESMKGIEPHLFGMVPIENAPPPVGVPLKVKTKDNDGTKEYIKYPVYYAKDPYSLAWAFWFFPALEGICKLSPEYSEVIAWEEIKEIDG